MTELKTLKNLGQTKRDCCSIEEDYSNICERCIKQEAIKWVLEDMEFVNNLRNKKSSQIILNRWISRFNITEEDLK